MPHEYQAFVASIEELEVGKAVTLTIRDLTPGPRKYDARIVKAEVSRSPSPGADRLWVRSWTGVLYPEPWYIRILEEAGEVETGLPHSDMTG